MIWNVLRTRLRLAVVLALLMPVLAGCQESPREQDESPAPAAGADAAPGQDTIDLSELGYERGSPDAAITVIEFSDFGCPYCARFALDTYPALHREFVETGRVRWQYVPFVMGMFTNGAEAARAAECAGEQDEFWAMHHHLFERQSQWKATDDPEATFTGFAASLGLDAGRFGSCYTEDRRGDRTQAANLAADRLGIRGTPTFLVNGYFVQGAPPLEQFRAALEDLSR